MLPQQEGFLGAICFSITSSDIYILNDYKDRHADRIHPEKCKRPIASGEVGSATAIFLFVVLAGLGLLTSFWLSIHFGLVVLVYFLLNIAYCFVLKHVSIIDIFCIAFGFILRIYAGSALIGVPPSIWILACSGLLALFIALAKRRDDVITKVDAEHRLSIKGYNLSFIDTCISIVLSALFISYTLYTVEPQSTHHIPSTHLYLTVPIVLLGIMRYLQITLVELRSGSPTRLLYSDKALMAISFAWAIVAGLIIYR